MTVENNIQIRPYKPTDLDELMEIELDSFSAPWTRQSYEELAPLDTVDIYVACSSGNIVGYMLLQYIGQEMELHTFAVKESFRRQGVGRKLLERMLAEARLLNVHKIFLLVRPSNIAARTLYEKIGFIALGVRKRYYHDNNEDAIVMKLEL